VSYYRPVNSNKKRLRDTYGMPGQPQTSGIKPKMKLFGMNMPTTNSQPGQSFYKRGPIQYGGGNSGSYGFGGTSYKPKQSGTNSYWNGNQQQTINEQYSWTYDPNDYNF
jgi:hypothetical protein